MAEGVKSKTLAQFEINRANEILSRTEKEEKPSPDDLKDAFEHILWAISFSENVHETVYMIEAAKKIYSQALDMLAGEPKKGDRLT